MITIDIALGTLGVLRTEDVLDPYDHKCLDKDIEIAQKVLGSYSGGLDALVSTEDIREAIGVDQGEWEEAEKRARVYSKRRTI